MDTDGKHFLLSAFIRVHPRFKSEIRNPQSAIESLHHSTTPSLSAGLPEGRMAGFGKPMITWLKLESFRLFTGLEIAPLKRINLFAGANNTGKTGILEALCLLFGGHEQLSLLPSAFRSALSNTPRQNGGDDFAAFWQALFYDRQTQTPALIYAKTGPDRMPHCRVQSLPDGRLWLFYEELDGSGRIADPARRIRNLRPPPSFTISANGVAAHGPNSFAAAFIALSTRLESPARDAELYNQVTLLEGGEEKLLQLLREIDPRLRKLRYAKAPGTDQPLVYACFGLKNALSLAQTGQGFNRLFSLYCQMLVSKSEVLLIDEIENGLHYETLPQVWKGIATLAASENIQVFATTHSRECVAAAHETMKALPGYDFALHRLQRVNGQLQAVTLDQAMLEAALHSGTEAR
jgi:hypothetical protein